MKEGYVLLDSGEGKKLERFGNVVLLRPCMTALWDPYKPYISYRNEIDAEFVRSGDTGEWNRFRGELSEWTAEIRGLRFQLKLTPFGHVGLFPEHSQFWNEISGTVSKEDRVLNLFAYTGGLSLKIAFAGATVVHVDSSKSAIRWAKSNVSLNGRDDLKIFWITDDAMTFLSREERREKKYEVIVADPPTYGRGTTGEIFKIEKDLKNLVMQSVKLLSQEAKFLLITSHTPGHTPLMLERLLKDALTVCRRNHGRVISGEVLLGESGHEIPSGVYVKWVI